MEKGKEQEMIERFHEGRLRNVQILIEGEGSETKKGCGCCLCPPKVLGAGDATAKQSARRFTDDLMVVVGSFATEA